MCSYLVARRLGALRPSHDPLVEHALRVLNRSKDTIGRVDQGLSVGRRYGSRVHEIGHLIDEGLELVDSRSRVAAAELSDSSLQLRVECVTVPRPYLTGLDESVNRLQK